MLEYAKLKRTVIGETKVEGKKLMELYHLAPSSIRCRRWIPYAPMRTKAEMISITIKYRIGISNKISVYFN